MKNNILKYIFFIFLIVIVAFTIYTINNKEEVPEGNTQKTANQEETKVEQVLNLGIAGFDIMNPILSSNKYVQSISKIIYEPLININSSYELENCIASEWAKTTETTYVIKLRENVRWSNGGDCTAEDVLYTIDRLKEITTNNIYIYNVQYIIQAEIIDTYTIKIILSKEIPFFEYNLNFPIMCKKYFGEESFKDSEKSKAPLGTGKYVISQMQDSKIILVKNENYWNKKNDETQIETIKIIIHFSNRFI